MNIIDAKVGRIVYHSITKKKGQIVKIEKYRFNLSVRVFVKWEDNTETKETASSLRLTLKTYKNRKIKNVNLLDNDILNFLNEES